MIKKAAILTALIIAIAIAVSIVLAYEHAPRPAEEEESTANTFGSFHTETIPSFDGQLRLEIDAENPMITLNVFDEKSDAKVYSFQPVRRWDFWGVCFENDNYNIWIQSGDIGIICYEYRDGKWHRSPDAVRPSYIVSKWENDT